MAKTVRAFLVFLIVLHESALCSAQVVKGLVARTTASNMPFVPEGRDSNRAQVQK